MISSYNNTIQNVTPNNPLTFLTDRILTGCTATRDGSTFQLNKPGYYYITFNANVAATEDLGALTIELFNNGVAIPGAIASETAAVAGNYSNLAFTTIVKISPSCCAVNNVGRLAFINTGVAATISNANVNITKLC